MNKSLNRQKVHQMVQMVVNLSPHVAGHRQKTSEQSHEHDGHGGNRWLRRRQWQPSPSLQATTSHRWSSRRPWFARCCWPPNCFLTNGCPKNVCAIMATGTWPTHTCELQWKPMVLILEQIFIVLGHHCMITHILKLFWVPVSIKYILDSWNQIVLGSSFEQLHLGFILGSSFEQLHLGFIFGFQFRTITSRIREINNYSEMVLGSSFNRLDFQSLCLETITRGFMKSTHILKLLWDPVPNNYISGNPVWGQEDDCPQGWWQVRWGCCPGGCHVRVSWLQPSRAWPTALSPTASWVPICREAWLHIEGTKWGSYSFKNLSMIETKYW